MREATRAVGKETRFDIVNAEKYTPLKWVGRAFAVSDGEIGAADARAFFEAECRENSLTHRCVNVVALPEQTQETEGRKSFWSGDDINEVGKWLSETDNCPGWVMRDVLKTIERRAETKEELAACDEDTQCGMYGAHLYMPAVGASRDRAVTMAQMNHHHALVYSTGLKTNAQRVLQSKRPAAIGKSFNRVMEEVKRSQQESVKKALSEETYGAKSKAAFTKQWALNRAELRRAEQQSKQTAMATFRVDPEGMLSMSAHILAPQFARTETELNLAIHDARHTQRGQGEKSNVGIACRASGLEKARRNALCGQEMMISIAYLGRENAILLALGETEGCIEEPADAEERYERVQEEKEVQLTDYRIPGIVTMHDTAGNIMQVPKFVDGSMRMFDSVVVRDVAALLEYIHSFAMERGKEYQWIRAECGSA